MNELDVRERTNSRLLRACVALAAMTVILSLSLGYFRFKDQASAHAQAVTVQRQDCARRLSSDQSAVKDAMAIAENQLIETLIAGIVTPEPDPTAQRALLSVQVNTLNTAIVAVQKLPALSAIVDRKCPSL